MDNFHLPHSFTVARKVGTGCGTVDSSVASYTREPGSLNPVISNFINKKYLSTVCIIDYV